MFEYFERILKVVSVVSNTPWILFVNVFFYYFIPVANFKIFPIQFLNPSKYHETSRSVLCNPFSSDFKDNAP